jgi:hypothetical protein
MQPVIGVFTDYHASATHYGAGDELSENLSLRLSLRAPL